MNLVVNPKIVTSKDHLEQHKNIGPVLVTHVMEICRGEHQNMTSLFLGYASAAESHSEIKQGTGASSNFNQSIN